SSRCGTRPLATHIGDSHLLTLPSISPRRLFPAMRWLVPVLALVAVMLTPALALAGEADLKLPDLTNTTVKATFLGMSGHDILLGGLLVCALGLAFGGMIYMNLKN